MDVLRETLEKNKDKYIKNLLDIVSIDTHVLGHGIEGGLEKQGQEFMEALFKDMGADNLILDPVKESIIKSSLQQYQEGNPGHNNQDRYNVYATFKGNGRKSIMFNGHIDTMPAEAELWKYPPHKPTIEDGKIYGLGACDMKGGLMAATMAVKLLKDSGIDLPGNVTITSVVDEEGGGNGSIIAAMNGQKADAVVVCEATDKELIAAHMGFIFFNVEIEGKANHSGAKWLGVSAIEKAIKIINQLNELEHHWLMVCKHPLLPSPSLNVGTIEGGTAGSTVAGHCKFQVCVHYLPGVMNYNSVVKEFTHAVELASQGDDWLKAHMPKITIYQAGGPFEMELDHPFVNSFKDAYAKATGEKVKIVGSPAGCDSRTWKNIAKCPTLQYGPGKLAQCHAVNEYLPIEEYLKSILIYANLILKFLN